jgi:glycosyltransferase involved in cell wall biosynthesis
MLEGYSYEFLADAETASPGGFRSINGAGVAQRIRALSPDVVFLNGISYRLFIRALITACRLGIPAWLRSETQDHAFARSRLKSAIRNVIYRVAYAQFSHFFPIGQLNAAHYRAHGVRDDQLTFCRYCVVDRFCAPPSELASRREAKRTSLQIPDGNLVVMFSGKLIDKKQPMLLIDGWRLLPEATRKSVTFLFVGSGEQEEALAAKAGASGASVIFAGFVNQSKIADYYLASDAVILPSKKMGETWGLVANEALLAGKPVILSKYAGSSVDFRNFLGVQVVDPTPDSVATAFSNLASQPKGDVIRNQMQNYTIEAAASAIAGRCEDV